MALSRVMDMVSQAEKEGVSLAVLISRELTVEEMDTAQEELARELDSNFESISSFMADIEVPSLEDALADLENSTDHVQKSASDKAESASSPY
jgi:hypothetical protein